MKKRFFYLLEIQYLGFRYHGWQKQPDVKTVQGVVLKTLQWIHPNASNKILASGRTDAMVSVQHTFIELFTQIEILNKETFLSALNINLPPDVRAISLQETTEKFNIIQSEKQKEYHYYFSFGEKFHPFCAAFMCNVLDKLDIPLMQKAAKKFEGKHDFYSYTYKPSENTQTVSEIFSCRLEVNKELTASFFPKESYVLKTVGAGFKRNQIRLMVGMLFELGTHQKSWSEFEKTLEGNNQIKLTAIAPASGLHLHKVELFESVEQ